MDIRKEDISKMRLRVGICNNEIINAQTELVISHIKKVHKDVSFTKFDIGGGRHFNTSGIAGVPENVLCNMNDVVPWSVAVSDAISAGYIDVGVTGLNELFANDISDTQKNKKSGTEDDVSTDYDKTEEKNSGSAKSGDDCTDGTEIRTNKKQKLKVHATKDGETTKIQFILQFGKAGDGGTYICNVKETNAGMSIEKTVLSDKDSNWKENKKAKVVCKSGTKLMFTANITKKQQSEEDIKLLEINVKFKEKGDKTTDGFNMTVRKENDGYYSYMKK